MRHQPTLPSITIVIEWENAIDVRDEWTCRAVAGLERELATTAPDMIDRPVVSYLFDRRQVDPAAIERVLRQAAPGLSDHADIELVPTEGLSYYELKNHGAARARTELSIFLDSDASPQPGWLRNMAAPFSDPSVQAVGGITVLAHENFFSRALALSWIFGLWEEREATAQQWGIYANNTAVRTKFFRTRPFPALKAYKYQCVFWLRGILAEKHRYVRVADAVTVHAPHPNYRFLFWRAWITGLDRDFYVFQLRARPRHRRAFKAITFCVGRTARTWWKIIRKHGHVGLPAWQVPPAMAIAFGYNATVCAGQLWSVIFRRHTALSDERSRLTAAQTVA